MERLRAHGFRVWSQISRRFSGVHEVTGSELHAFNKSRRRRRPKHPQDQVRELIGDEKTALLRDTSLRLFSEAHDYARQRGIIIADTKFEFGLDKNGELLLVDEVLTPDSSRFWPADEYKPGRSQPSFDKQFVRDYLETLDWDKKPPAPAIPAEIAAATTARYLEAYRLLTGKEL